MRRIMMSGVLLLLCSALLGATVFREQVAQAAEKISPVRIANTPAEPVPVHEQGTVAVREQATLQPVQVAQFGSFPTGQRFSSEETLYTVPAGKTLVIEAFSASSIMSPDDRFMDARLEMDLNGEEVNWFLQPTDEGVFSSTNGHVFRGSALVGGYAGPGTTVRAAATRDGTSLSGTAVSSRLWAVS